MADKKISTLTAVTAPTATDLVHIVTDMSTTPTNKRITVQNFFTTPSANTANTNAITSTSAGQLAYVTDGNGGSPCLAVHNGTSWLRVTLGAAIASS
tara:strand:- start:791 stop:1081 length:291 start_codon:yes stop_codon:yes gene_type:complete